jgi:hypothetical protein
MKTTTTHRSGADIEKAVAQAIITRLDEGVETLPHDITERLKAARTQALAKRKVAVEMTRARPVFMSADGQASMPLGNGFKNLWMQLGSWLPLLALITGMLLIDTLQDEFAAQEIADVDVQLLTDPLPPAAYTDPGFAQFLRINQEK